LLPAYLRASQDGTGWNPWYQTLQHPRGVRNPAIAQRPAILHPSPDSTQNLHVDENQQDTKTRSDGRGEGGKMCRSPISDEQNDTPELCNRISQRDPKCCHACSGQHRTQPAGLEGPPGDSGVGGGGGCGGQREDSLPTARGDGMEARGWGHG